MILIIDHNDSFTYNLYQYFLELQEEVQVVSATNFSLEIFQQLVPEMVVLSPGPGSPEDFPVSLALLGKIQVPILGICLGHQMIGHFFWGKSGAGKSPGSRKNKYHFAYWGRVVCRACTKVPSNALPFFSY